MESHGDFGERVVLDFVLAYIIVRMRFLDDPFGYNYLAGITWERIN